MLLGLGAQRVGFLRLEPPHTQAGVRKFAERVSRSAVGSARGRNRAAAAEPHRSSSLQSSASHGYLAGHTATGVDREHGSDRVTHPTAVLSRAQADGPFGLKASRPLVPLLSR